MKSGCIKVSAVVLCLVSGSALAVSSADGSVGTSGSSNNANSSVAYVSPVEAKIKQANDAFIRPYVGVSIGYDSTLLTANFVNVGALNNKYGLNGTSYGGYAGVQLNPFKYYEAFHNIRLGIEGYAQAISHAQVSDVAAGPPTPVFQKKTNYGLSALPGYQFTDRMEFFVRIGAEWSRFNYSNTITGDYNYSNYSTGFQYGLGALYNLTSHLGLRLEYDRTNYAQIKYSHAGSALDENLNYATNAFQLGLEWLF